MLGPGYPVVAFTRLRVSPAKGDWKTYVRIVAEPSSFCFCFWPFANLERGSIEMRSVGCTCTQAGGQPGAEQRQYSVRKRSGRRHGIIVLFNPYRFCFYQSDDTHAHQIRFEGQPLMFGKQKRRWPTYSPEVMLQLERVRGHAYPRNSTAGERMVHGAKRQNQRSRMKMKPQRNVRISH